MQFSLLTLNIERRKHHNRVRPFLMTHRPDVICLQEVFEDTAETFAKELYYNWVFAPRAEFHDEPGREGVAILTHFAIQDSKTQVYERQSEVQPELAHIHTKRPMSSLLTADLCIDDQTATVATTHFTWSPGGIINEDQKANFEVLLKLLEETPEFILAGDFNSPRGTEVFDTLAKRYTDNIPSSVTSTIDPHLHKAGQLEYVVDGLFTTRRYQVDNVSIIDGLSDHCGITATIIY